jgi:iron complex outermembrane receptor protein
MLNCNLGGSRGAYYCGTLPDWDELPFGAISAMDDFSPFLYEQLIENPRGFYEAFDSHFFTDFGMKRHNFQTSLRADYDMSGGYVLSFLGGYHWDKLHFISDLTMVDGRMYNNPNYPSVPDTLPYPTWIMNEQQDSWDYSVETRITSPADRRLRWAMGVSYLRADSVGSTYSQKPNGPGPSRGPSRTYPSTLGIFGGVYYNVTPSFTVTLEGRYQEDKIAIDQIGGNDGFAYPDGPVKLSGKFSHIAPRISLDYRFSDNSMVYVLFSQGFRPGGFNAELRTLPPFELEQVRKLSGVGVTYDEEQLDNYELGLKSTLLGGRARVTVAAYYNELTEGQTRDTIPVVTEEGVTTTVSLIANIGVIDLWGLELEGEFRVNQSLKIGATANFVDTEVKNFFCSDCVAIYGSPDATGNELQQTVKSKYVFYADYTRPLGTDRVWYVRGDYSYRDGYWLTTANVAKTAPQNLLGLRVGIESESLGLELYGTNLLYDKGLRGSPGFDTLTSAVGLGLPNEIRLSLPDKRAFGFKASYKF